MNEIAMSVGYCVMVCGGVAMLALLLAGACRAWFFAMKEIYSWRWISAAIKEHAKTTPIPKCFKRGGSTGAEER